MSISQSIVQMRSAVEAYCQESGIAVSTFCQRTTGDTYAFKNMESIAKRLDQRMEQLAAGLANFDPSPPSRRKNNIAAETEEVKG